MGERPRDGFDWILILIGRKRKHLKTRLIFIKQLIVKKTQEFKKYLLPTRLAKDESKSSDTNLLGGSLATGRLWF